MYKKFCIFYFLLTLKPDNKNEQNFIREYQNGEMFGELALLYNAPRAANIFAKTDCTLWSLDRLTFNGVVRNAAIKKRMKYENFLKNTPIFATVDDYELTRIVDAVKPAKFKAGTLIIKEKDKGDIFYILENGQAYATKSITPTETKKVMDYQKGSYFGELALLKNIPRAANVIAKVIFYCRKKLD